MGEMGQIGVKPGLGRSPLARQARRDNELSPDYGDASPSQVRSGRLSLPPTTGVRNWRASLGWVQATNRCVKEQEEGLRVKDRSPFTKMGKAHQENI
jgi:hypothetical protein